MRRVSFDEVRIRELYASGLTQAQVAAEIGCSRMTVVRALADPAAAMVARQSVLAPDVAIMTPPTAAQPSCPTQCDLTDDELKREARLSSLAIYRGLAGTQLRLIEILSQLSREGAYSSQIRDVSYAVSSTQKDLTSALKTALAMGSTVPHERIEVVFEPLEIIDTPAPEGAPDDADG